MNIHALDQYAKNSGKFTDMISNLRDGEIKEFKLDKLTIKWEDETFDYDVDAGANELSIILRVENGSESGLFQLRAWDGSYSGFELDYPVDLEEVEAYEVSVTKYRKKQ